ncbi:MAG: phosphodiesterase [Hyphomicrobiaceae bacterium]|nr:phosphodiesterase [Hyphomicrobiaceae bacterium]
MRFVILTDTHFVAAGHTLYSIDPAQRLAAALDVIARDHRDISCIVITGDLAHWGQREAYENLRSVLARAHVPVRVLMGNHDLRAPFRSVFPDADDDGHGFVQCLRVEERFTMLILDTLDEEGPTHAGLLCSRRLAFLQDALGAAPRDRPLLVFQHHPPFATGLPHMDRIKLRNGADELAILARIRKPDYMFMGHIHRPISGVWHGIPFHIQRALAHQVSFDLTTPDRIPGSLEAPDYALVEVVEGQIVVHQRSFLYAGPQFWLDDKDAQASRGFG